MLAAIFSQVGLAFVDKFLDKGMTLIQAYLNKQITMEELRTKLVEIAVSSAKDIEITHANVLAQTYSTFMGAVEKSLLMQRVWASVTLSQLFVLVWSQFFVPLLFAFGMLPNWKAGTSAEWAYLLVGACVGMGPMVLRSGPGAGSILERLKGMLGK